MQGPQIVVTCQTHGEIARMPASWTPMRVLEELQVQCSGQECCRTAAITLVDAQRMDFMHGIKPELLHVSELNLKAAREENDQLRAEIEQVRTSAARVKIEAEQDVAAVERIAENARKVLLDGLERYKYTKGDPGVEQAAELAVKLIGMLNDDTEALRRQIQNLGITEGKLLEQLKYVRRVLQEALEPFAGTVDLEADVMTLAALAQQRIRMQQEVIKRAALGPAEASAQPVDGPEPGGAHERYDVAERFGLGLFDGNAVVRLLNVKCGPEERLRHLDRARFYLGREIDRLKRQSPSR